MYTARIIIIKGVQLVRLASLCWLANSTATSMLTTRAFALAHSHCASAADIQLRLRYIAGREGAESNIIE